MARSGNCFKPLTEYQSFDAKSLLAWFSKYARPLPWREHYKPYDVVLSEFMLQQTQVVTALPYYERWLKKWPTWSSLARAKESEVLKMWEGLGYYQRARRLHALAQHLEHNNIDELPQNREELMKFPGLGPYTSAAVASIAFNQAEMPIDGNVRRVLARYYRRGEKSPSKEQDAFFEEQLIPVFKRVKRRRDLAQALMELGASHCSPRNPDCENCPINKTCAMKGPEEAMDYPLKKARKKPEPLFISYIWVQSKDGFYLKQRPAKGRFPNQWEPPSVETQTYEEGKESLENMFPKLKLKSLEPIRRDFTRFRVMWHPYIAKGNIDLEGFEVFEREEVLSLNLVPVMLKQFIKDF